MRRFELDANFYNGIGGEGCLGGYIYLPDNCDTRSLETDFPLVIYLHGAGERGTNPANVERHAIPRLIKEGRNYNAIILAPQCPAQFAWGNVVERAKATIDAVVKKFGIKKDRIAITGSSMGGFGTSDMVMCYRSFFSAAGIVAGGGLPWRAGNMVNTKLRFYHGSADEAVTPLESKRLFDVAKAYGCDCTYTILDGLDHNDGIEYSYEKTDIIDFLINARRTNFDYVPEFLEEMF